MDDDDLLSREEQPRQELSFDLEAEQEDQGGAEEAEIPPFDQSIEEAEDFLLELRQEVRDTRVKIAEKMSKEDTKSIKREPTMTTENIGGSAIKVKTHKKAFALSSRILYPKEKRDSLDADKRQSLFDKATATKQKKYGYLNVKLTSADLLEDSYNLNMLIQVTKEKHVDYDMHSVFTVVIPKGDGSTSSIESKTYDLYTEYTKILPLQVALSNQWYNEWPTDNYHQENLGLTTTYLANNMEHDLWTKTMEEYNTYPEVKKVVHCSSF